MDGPGRHRGEHRLDAETYAALEPTLRGRPWLNYLNDDQGERRVRSAPTGPNYERLVEVKRRYDPDNVFHLNHNIAPSSPRGRPAAQQDQ